MLKKINIYVILSKNIMFLMILLLFLACNINNVEPRLNMKVKFKDLEHKLTERYPNESKNLNVAITEELDDSFDGEIDFNISSFIKILKNANLDTSFDKDELYNYLSKELKITKITNDDIIDYFDEETDKIDIEWPEEDINAQGDINLHYCQVLNKSSVTTEETKMEIDDSVLNNTKKITNAFTNYVSQNFAETKIIDNTIKNYVLELKKKREIEKEKKLKLEQEKEELKKQNEQIKNRLNKEQKELKNKLDLVDKKEKELKKKFALLQKKEQKIKENEELKKQNEQINNKLNKEQKELKNKLDLVDKKEKELKKKFALFQKKEQKIKENEESIKELSKVDFKKILKLWTCETCNNVNPGLWLYCKNIECLRNKNIRKKNSSHIYSSLTKQRNQLIKKEISNSRIQVYRNIELCSKCKFFFAYKYESCPICNLEGLDFFQKNEINSDESKNDENNVWFCKYCRLVNEKLATKCAICEKQKKFGQNKTVVTLQYAKDIKTILYLEFNECEIYKNKDLNGMVYSQTFDKWKGWDNDKSLIQDNSDKD